MKGFEQTTGSLLFHAGTKVSKDKVVTNGGRVLAITTLANQLDEALSTSMKNAEIIQYSGKNYRKDIGFDLKKILVKA